MLQQINNFECFPPVFFFLIIQQLDLIKKDQKSKQASTPKFDEKVVQFENKVKVAEKQYEDIQKELNELGTQMQELQPRHAMVKEKINAVRMNVKKIEVNSLRNLVVKLIGL